MNSVDRTTKPSTKSSPAMWLDIVGILLGVTTVFGLPLLRAEFRDRADDQRAIQPVNLESPTQVIASDAIAKIQSSHRVR